MIGKEKLHRIALWAKRPHQINHRIVRAFLEISEKRKVTLEELKNRCECIYNIKRFMINFRSMKSDEGHSHAKVFYINDDGFVEIYSDTMKEIKKYEKYFRL